MGLDKLKKIARKKIKKDYFIGLNIERADAVKKYLKDAHPHKVPFSFLMDELLKEFYNKHKKEIGG